MREPAINWPIAICLALLIAFGAGMSWALHSLRDAIGFWPFMAFGAVLIPLMIAGGFIYDRVESRRNRSQQSQLEEIPYPPPPVQSQRSLDVDLTRPRLP